MPISPIRATFPVQLFLLGFIIRVFGGSSEVRSWYLKVWDFWGQLLWRIAQSSGQPNRRSFSVFFGGGRCCRGCWGWPSVCPLQIVKNINTIRNGTQSLGRGRIMWKYLSDTWSLKKLSGGSRSARRGSGRLPVAAVRVQGDDPRVSIPCGSCWVVCPDDCDDGDYCCCNSCK